MKLFKSKVFFLLTLLSCTLVYGVVTDFKEYLPLAEKTEENLSKMNTLLALFAQKIGDTLTGNLTFSDVGEGVQMTEGTASAQGLSGTIAFVTGGLDTVSNATVTAKSRIFFTRTGQTAPLLVTMSATNQVGKGFKMIPSVESTNAWSFFITHGQ